MTKGRVGEGTPFHLQLLMNIIDMTHYPFTKLIIDREFTQTEYKELMSLLTELDHTYQSQKEQGLLNFSSLLVHFAGMLNEKVSPTETITSLKEEKLFVELMNEFENILEDEYNDDRDVSYSRYISI